MRLIAIVVLIEQLRDVRKGGALVPRWHICLGERTVPRGRRAMSNGRVRGGLKSDDNRAAGGCLIRGANLCSSRYARSARGGSGLRPPRRWLLHGGLFF